MTPAEKKKVALASGMLTLAVVIAAWYFMSGSGGSSRDAQAAQQKVLEKMGNSSTPADGTEPAPSKPAGEPAGRPRSVRPGSS